MENAVKRYIMPATVVDVHKRSQVTGGYKDKGGIAHVGSADLGWFVVVEPGFLSFGVGEAKPSFKPGDKVRLVVESMQ